LSSKNDILVWNSGWFLHVTVNILPGLLNTEPYSNVIVTLFSRGDALLHILEVADEKHENEEVIIRWNNVMSLLEQSIANEGEL